MNDGGVTAAHTNANEAHPYADRNPSALSAISSSSCPASIRRP